MTRKRRLAPVRDLEKDQIVLRYKLFSWLKEKDFPPAAALGVVVSVAGTLAASQKVGRWKFAWACWKAYGMEKVRLLAAKAGMR